MAVGITITPQITGQQADSTNSYCYLWEPLRVAIEEADVAAKKIYIELTTYSTEDSIVLNEALVKYAEYDINPGQPLTIDLMKIASQHHDSNVYKYSNISQMIDALGGWKSVVSEWRYKFRITSDITTTPVEIRKLPIIGGRIFKDFTAVVDETQDMIESDIHGVDLNLGRYDGMTYLITSLKDPSLQDCSPSVTTSTVGDSESLTQYCGGQLIWKSRFGGWLSWGFKQLEEKYSKQRYNGQVDVGMFESTSITNGTPYVPVNYTGITSDYSITLKELGLSSAELQTVASISSSPAVYRVLNDDGDLELMQVVNASHPLVNSANGGDFSVTLKSVSETFQKTR